MNTRWLLLLTSVAGCTGTSSSSADASKGACGSAIATGIAGRSVERSDTSDGLSPNSGMPIVVFRADDPGFAQPIPAELAMVAEHLRGDLDIGPPGARQRRRIAVPARLLGAPVGTATTDAEGCFGVELQPGTYALAHADSMLWIDVDVVAGRTTSCGYSTGDRFATWDCAD